MFPRDRAFALRGKVHDDLGLLAIEKLEQKVQLVRDVAGMIFVLFTPFDPEREWLRAQRIATNADHFLWVCMIQQIERCMNAEAAAAAEDRVRFSRHEFLFPLFYDGPIIIAGIAR